MSVLPISIRIVFNRAKPEELYCMIKIISYLNVINVFVLNGAYFTISAFNRNTEQ